KYDEADYFLKHTLIRYKGQWGFVENEYLLKPQVQDMIKKTLKMDKIFKIALPVVGVSVLIIIAIVALMLSKKKKNSMAIEL
ncbi:MAG: hypothetical protein ACTTH0_02990, partial [Eubacteriales bacterium]